MKETFKESFEFYNDYMSRTQSDYWEHYSFEKRRSQIKTFINSINDNFNFEKLITIETGVSSDPRDGIFGLFLGYATSKTNGQMLSVDINEDRIKKNEILFKENIPELNHSTHQGDSVKFLENLEIIPNLIHLDSWDLDLKNPFPSALHGWREFVAIESKMPSGSIIIVDDNYINGTWVDWYYPNGITERITIEYPLIGKGANIFNFVLNNESNWKLIGEHYHIQDNIKIILQKQ